MKILYDWTIFQQQYGGISRYFCELITRLADYDDVDIDLFMGLFVNRYGLERYDSKFANFWGHRLPAIRRTGFMRRKVNSLIWRWFQSKLSAHKNSIYHPTYYNFFDCASSKKIFTVHDFTHERYPRFFDADPTVEQKKKAFEAADGLICISETTRADLEDLYEIDPSCEVTVILHGYNDMLNKEDSAMPGLDAPYLLFVGPRHHYKNFTCLVEAYVADASLMKDFKIVCFGGAFTLREKNLFEKHGIQGKVLCFSGGDDVLCTLYKSAHVFVYPSLYEGFGFPPLEAMSCGCPVVASSTSSIPEVVGEAAVMFDPSSSESLRCSLRAAAGLERCKMFSWDRCARETYEFYKKIMS